MRAEFYFKHNDFSVFEFIPFRLNLNDKVFFGHLTDQGDLSDEDFEDIKEDCFVVTDIYVHRDNIGYYQVVYMSRDN